MWVARDKDNSLYLYEEKPSKLSDCWIDNGHSICSKIASVLFPKVVWQDEEPTEIVIKKKEIQNDNG